MNIYLIKYLQKTIIGLVGQFSLHLVLQIELDFELCVQFCDKARPLAHAFTHAPAETPFQSSAYQSEIAKPDIIYACFDFICMEYHYSQIELHIKGKVIEFTLTIKLILDFWQVIKLQFAQHTQLLCYSNGSFFCETQSRREIYISKIQ